MNSTDFRAARLQLGLTQAELGRIMGMPQQSIARIETGIRRITAIQAAFIRVLVAIQSAGLLDNLKNNSQKNAQE